jgi:hypothetical protein
MVYGLFYIFAQAARKLLEDGSNHKGFFVYFVAGYKVSIVSFLVFVVNVFPTHGFGF